MRKKIFSSDGLCHLPLPFNIQNFLQYRTKAFKLMLFAAFLMIHIAARSQQTLIQITQWNWNAYVHVPADYGSNPNKVYPTIIFFPGIGEIGTNASLVIENGPGAYLAQGWDGNVSIGTADSVEFIIASVQPVQSWPVNVQTAAVIQALKGLYRVDPNKLYLTGLSMGGWECSQFVTGDSYGDPYPYASQVAAEVNVEGVAINDAAPSLILWDNFAKTGGRIACFEQLNDFRDMQAYVNQMDSVKPGSGLYTQTDFGDGSHCCWSSFYGGEGAIPTNFTLDGVSQNIYQWMAKQSLTAQGNAVPSITSATTASGTIGTAFSYTIAASNIPTSYAASGLPAGLTINTSTGIISGTPTATGTSSVTIKATNANGSGTATLAITINPPAPVISSATTASGTVGAAFSYTITASNSPTLYTVVGMPAGLNLNTSTGAISGTPTTAGTYSVTINAVNAGGTGTKTLTLTINATVVAPVISSATTATGTVGTAFSYTITASNTPTSYAASGLPAGLTVNTSTGVISGTPTTTGTSNVTISAINKSGTGSQILSVTIAGTIIVYFQNTGGWAQPKVYCWSPTPTTYGNCSSWPGNNMTQITNCDGNWWTYTFTGVNTINLIFDNGSTGSSNQTANLSLSTSGTYNYSWSTQTWSNGIPPCPPIVSISPSGTSFTDSLQVSLAAIDANSGSVIYYTTNGQAANNTSTVYTKPFWVKTTTTVNATAYAGGVAAITPVSATYTKISNITVYFENTTGWQQPKVYCWSPTPSTYSGCTTWPGNNMTKVANCGNWWSYTFTGVNATSLLFNDGGSNQTADLSLTSSGIYNFSWSTKLLVTGTPTCTPIPASINVYFENTASWAQPKVYCWTPTPSTYGGCTAWPGNNMSKVASCGNWWTYAFTGVTATSLIFSDGGSNQTTNLSLNAAGTYNYSWTGKVWVNGAPVCTAARPSFVQSFNIGEEMIATVNPNPVINNNLQLLIQNNIGGNATIKIVDLAGRLIKQLNNIEIKPGNNNLSLNLGKITSGYYVAFIQKAEYTAHIKFMVN